MGSRGILAPGFAFVILFSVSTAAAHGIAAPQIPLTFEANAGQADRDVKFIARGTGYGALLTPTAIVLGLRPQKDAAPVALRLGFAGARANAKMVGVDALPGQANYFTGNDPARWRRGVGTFARVRAREVWRGIDVVYYGNGSRLEFDFVVAPGADPRVIALAVEGADAIELEAGGELVVKAAGRSMRLQNPIVYQEVDGVRRDIAGGYRLEGARRVRFDVADYDASRPLVIDPVLTYSSYLGGGQDDVALRVAVDNDGFVYLTGMTASTNFPLKGAIQPHLTGANDAFVTKLTPKGQLVYSTYLGGRASQQGFGIAADRKGNAYVTGYTTSTDFPTLNALQPTLQGTKDAFVVKLDPFGRLVYATYLGGSGHEIGYGIGVDTTGSAIVTGETGSQDFPTQTGIQTTLGGHWVWVCLPWCGWQWVYADSNAFVTRLDPKGSSIIYSTYLGGWAQDQGLAIAIGPDAVAYVAGMTTSPDFPLSAPLQATYGGATDAFVAKLDPWGKQLFYSTYLGGSRSDNAEDIAVDRDGNAYVVGITASPDFRTANPLQALNGGQDGFVAKLNPLGSALVYSTYLGGSSWDSANGIAVDGRGSAYIGGITNSVDFPKVNAFQPTTSGSVDGFVAKLNPAGTALVYSTYLGGSDFDVTARVALDAERNLWVTGLSQSIDFPTTPTAIQAANAGGSDAVIARLTDVFAYVANRGSASLSMLDVATNVPAPPIPVGSGPWGVAVTPDGRVALLTDIATNVVHVVETGTGAVLAPVSVNSPSLGVAVSPDGSLAMATEFYTSSVSVIDLATRAVVTTVPVGAYPVGVVFTPDGGQAFVANAGDDSVSVLVISRASGVISVSELLRIPVGSVPYGVAIPPDGLLAYVTNLGADSVSVIETRALAEIAQVPVGTRPRGVAAAPTAPRVYIANSGAGNLSVIDTRTHTVVATIPVGSGPEGVAVSPGSTRVYVTNTASNTVSVIDAGPNAVVATPAVGTAPAGIAVTP
jgi:YVTN family beta-propeller protein